ncbi:4-diphosphocytidyl-2-C-methyl-D-erythritol kinase [Anopheles sinensis]|uniref:4-diphosphocytidyl-2-C-methyl-D-erythritol kinase n=1 Tax=Anopheles sinensis TaxID=74873 RepID=A0A084W520_ANOSI|nr:4-diphosphocytidyl-2-C-methyl-D-erythritol kinase [Anopheles sinensis]
MAPHSGDDDFIFHSPQQRHNIPKRQVEILLPCLPHHPGKLVEQFVDKSTALALLATTRPMDTSPTTAQVFAERKGKTAEK